MPHSPLTHDKNTDYIHHPAKHLTAMHEQQTISTPIFILGTQRSGTTLLTRILSAHPSIYIQNEIDLPSVFGRGLDKNGIIHAIADCVEQDEGVPIRKLLAESPGMIWGLKDPQLTEHIDELRPFLPDTRFLVIVRDGRGVTNSYMENKWGLGTNVYTGAQRWRREVEQQEAFMKEAPERFLYLRYEDLVDDTQGTVRKVCDHLGVDFDPGILDYHKRESYYQVKRENVHTHRKPDKTLTEKWKRKLSRFQVGVIEAVAGDTLERHGYPLQSEPVTLNRWQIAYYRIHQKIIGEIQLQYRWRKSMIEAKKKKARRDAGGNGGADA